MEQRAPYPSDITSEQFEVIRPRLENFSRRTKPRVLDLYDVFCGMLYVLRSACQWRMLPKDFPRYKTVYFAVLPKRWVVERSFGWLEKHRRLWKNCELLLNNSLHVVSFAFLCLHLKRL